MSAHLSHKLPWHLLVDYVTPHKDPGISLPVGTCGRIHIINKKVELQVKNRKFIRKEDICTDTTCIEKPKEKIFYKNEKKKKIFDLKEHRGRLDEEKCSQFFDHFEKVVLEFVQTEMTTPAKDLEYEVDESGFVSYCDSCNRFTTLLEFGDKKELLKYTDEEIFNVFSCLHGGQAVGNNQSFLMGKVLTFYLNMNIVLYANLKEEDWPSSMKPDSYYRMRLLYPCDGQTFPPHSRKYLPEAMIDLEKTKILNKNLFRFIYFYVMMRMKINERYTIQNELSSWIIRTATSDCFI